MHRSRRSEMRNSEKNESTESESMMRSEGNAGAIEMMQQWMDHSQVSEEERSKRTKELRQLTLTRLSPTEDIEAYFSIFERMMEAFKVKRQCGLTN